MFFYYVVYYVVYLPTTFGFSQEEALYLTELLSPKIANEIFVSRSIDSMFCQN